MSFGDQDLDIFVAEFGEDATFGGVTVKGIFDESDEIQPTAESTMDAVIHVATLQILTSAWPTVADGSEVTVSSRTWVCEGGPRQLDDGKFKLLSLVEVTS